MDSEEISTSASDPPHTISSAEDGSVDEGTDSSVLELTEGLKQDDKERKGGKDDEAVPPPVPQSGISILAHKIWIGNLDKRLSQ